MATQKRNNHRERAVRPATTFEGRENQLIANAVDLAEKQLREGTASAQVISHYLKLGSSRERLEQERLSGENKLLDAKIEALKSAKNIEALYSEALNAMKSYSGQEDYDEEEYYD
jgi:hypothetical protein